MGALSVFLDANVLFSAALGGPSFELLWELAEDRRIELVTTRYCRVEAERNLARKRPVAKKRFYTLLKSVREVPEASGTRGAVGSAVDTLPEKDVPVYEAAVAHAGVLLTGDRKHFGALMARGDLPLRVRTVRDFLAEGPD